MSIAKLTPFSGLRHLRAVAAEKTVSKIPKLKVACSFSKRTLFQHEL